MLDVPPGNELPVVVVVVVKGYLPFTLPARSRSAWVPNETRLANGDVGVVIGVSVSPSLSSATASSIFGELESIELETLPRRFMADVADVGPK